MKFTRFLTARRLGVWTGLILLSIFIGFLVNVLAAPPADDPAASREVSLNETDNGRQVTLSQDEVLVVSLESNPSTGYTWEIAPLQKQDEPILHQRGDSGFEAQTRPLGAGGPILGAPTRQVLQFESSAAGQTELRLVYRRPWEKDVPPLKTFAVQVQTAGPSRVKPTSPTPTPENSIAATDQPLLGLPVAYNWCDSGGCTPVKDQGNCGSCWTFGTVGPLELNIKIKDTLTQDLAEQYLLSCNTEGWSCRGGWWAHDYHLDQIPPGESTAGAVYEADFPYQFSKVACNFTPQPHTHHEKIVSWAYVGSEYGIPGVDAIKQAIVDHGPVAAAVCVGSAFQNYGGGVFQTNEGAACGSSMANHAIVLVGWNDSSGTWRLRNSWGTDWGEDGYMNIKYGISNVGYAANYVIYGGSDCRDAYETDNVSADAKSITPNGSIQRHNFNVANDVDWVKFTTTGGSVYTITTSNLETSNNTNLALYGTDGTTLIPTVDGCVGPTSCINSWTAPATGTYFISVTHISNAGACTGYGYDLAVSSNVVAKTTAVYLPLILKSPGCNNSQLVQNGGLESGNVIWTEWSVSDYNIIGPANQGYYPHSGAWSAWFGGYDDADDRLYQTISIPPGVSSAQLTVYLYVETIDSLEDEYDDFHVELQDGAGNTLQSFLSANNTMSSGDWYIGTVRWNNTFSAHAGQIRRLYFQGTTDYSLYTNFFVDDVTFSTYCGSLSASSAETDWNWQKLDTPPGYTRDRPTKLKTR